MPNKFLLNRIFLTTFAFLISLSDAADDSCVVKSYDQVEEIVQNCTDITIGDLVVPGGKTLNLQLLDNARVTIDGTVSFEYGGHWYGPLVQINGTGIHINGNRGFFDGNGSLYWDGQGGWSNAKPQFFKIQAYNSTFLGFYVQNAPEGFISLSDSDFITFDHFVLDNLKAAPERTGPNKAGHNTDGFVVFNSSNVYIARSNVYNQDDCIALQSGENITVTNMYCYGGHGLSISVGHSNDSFKLNTLKNVTIKDSRVTNGRNAIHIKTRVDGGDGIISDVVYRDIQFSGQADYGVNIQQNYQNLPPGSHQPAEARGNIPINRLDFSLITGDFAFNYNCIPLYINCAAGACNDWQWHDVTVSSNFKNNECNFEPHDFSCNKTQNF